MSEADPLEHAPQAELARALTQTCDQELRVRAACAAGDQLRFAVLPSLSPALAQALRVALEAAPAEAPAANERRGAEPTWSDLRFEAAVALCEARDLAPQAQQRELPPHAQQRELPQHAQQRELPQHAQHEASSNAGDAAGSMVFSGEVLIGALSDPTRRFDAVKALSRLDTARVRQALTLLLGRWFLSWPDRLVTSAALARLGDSQGGRYFDRQLTSRWFPARRTMAIHLLGDLRHPNAFSILNQLIARETGDFRSAAVRALGHLGDRRAVPRLHELANAEDPELVQDARYALELLG